MLEKKVKLIAIGSYPATYYGLKSSFGDYDFVISTELENLELICKIITKNYLFNSEIFKSNVCRTLKLKTADYRVDLIKKVIGYGPKFYCVGNKKLNSRHLNYENLINNTEKIKMFDFPVCIISKNDYIDSQINRPQSTSPKSK